MKMDHAHVEASVVSILLIGIVAIVDIWANIADQDPRKIIYYSIGFGILYSITRVIFKKLWSGD
jgi:hypothetical protein